MVDATRFLPGLSPVQRKAVVARLDGGRLSSEGLARDRTPAGIGRPAGQVSQAPADAIYDAN